MLIIISCTCADAKVSTVYITHTDHVLGELDKMNNGDLREAGRVAGRSGDLEKAEACFALLSSRFSPSQKESDRMICANAFNDLGVIYYMKRDHVRAYRSFEEAIATGIPEVENAAIGNIAAIFYYYGLKSEAMSRLRKIYDYSLKNKDWRQLSFTHVNMVNYYLSVDSLDSFRKEIESFRNVDTTRDNVVRRVWMFNDAILSLSNNNPAEAIDKLHNLIRHGAELAMMKSDTISIYGNIADIHLRNGNHDAAEAILLEAMEINGNRPNEETMELCKSMAECMRLKGDSDKYLYWKERHLAMRDSLFTTEKFSLIKDYSFSKSTDAIRDELNIIKHDRDIKARILVIVCAVFAVVIILVVIIIFKIKRLRQEQDFLYKRKDVVLEIPMDDHTALEPATDDCVRENVLSDEELDNIKHKIVNYMDNSEEWMMQSFSPERMAHAVDVPARLLPEIIRNGFGTNFYGLLNRYRIKEACRILSDKDKLKHLTIEGISQSLGFKSRSNFGKNFKNLVGMSPSEYIAASERANTKDSAKSD